MDDLVEIPTGPAMEALTPLQRGFVLAMLADPLATPTEWARAAGYDQDGSDRVAGHRLSRNPKIEAAATELARAHLNTFGPVLGIGVMMMIARNSEHRDQLKAAAMLANRSGFHEKTEAIMSVMHSDRRGAALEGRIRALAETLGVDADRLLGTNAPKQIEGEVVRSAED
jgi:phage terminase small subunit